MSFLERVRVFLRLHFLQALWNFKGMQNFGCLSALRPSLDRIHSGEERVAAEKRHVQFFNTHPYFAPICIGVMIRLEEDLKSGAFARPEMIPLLKNRMSGPLAAVGDAFFWETVRPIMTSIAVFAVYFFGAGAALSWIVLACVVVLYLLQVETLRWQGLGWGYRHGMEVVEVLKRKDFQSSMKRVRNAGAFLLGIVSVLFILPFWAVPGRLFFPVIVIRSAVLGLLLYATWKKISPTVTLYLLALAGFCLGWVLT